MSTENILRVSEILETTAGSLLSGNSGTVVSGITTDTRHIVPDTLFIALEGENFDGHDFVKESFEKGASAILGETEKLLLQKDLIGATVIGVEDSLRALGDIAHYWRMKHDVKILALTGSNGKTSTKEMIAELLSGTYSTLKNVLNLNNLIGVPITLLNLRADHEVAVIEMGMNRPGEISRLTEIADPDFALITNIHPAHLEGLKTLKGIQEAKGELFSGIRDDSTLLVNLNEPLVVELAKRHKKKRVTFGTSSEADIRLVEVVSQLEEGSRFVLRFPDGEAEMFLPVLGKHHIANALASACAAWTMGISIEDIKDGLAKHKPVRQRMDLKRLPGDIHLLDDTYNANPVSLASALETLSLLKGNHRALAVLGGMLELGPDAERFHRKIGERVAQLNFDGLLSIGELGAEIIEGARRMGMPEELLFLGQDHSEVAKKLKSLLQPGDWILVKGSRGFKMEVVIEELLKSQEVTNVEWTEKKKASPGC